MLAHELECLQQPDGLVNRASHREVVDRDLVDHALGIDDEKTCNHDHDRTDSPRRAMPDGKSTWYASEISFVTSARRGI